MNRTLKEATHYDSNEKPDQFRLNPIRHTPRPCT